MMYCFHSDLHKDSVNVIILFHSICSTGLLCLISLIMDLKTTVYSNIVAQQPFMTLKFCIFIQNCVIKAIKLGNAQHYKTFCPI